jgi:hypothetical protein
MVNEPEMAERDTGDDEQDADVDTRPMVEATVHPQPDITVGPLPQTPLPLKTAPASSVYGKVSRHLQIKGFLLIIY